MDLKTAAVTSVLGFKPVRLAVALLAAGLIASGLEGCQSAKSQSGGTMLPPEVVVAVAEPRDLPVTYEYPGRIAGFREVEVRPRVSGILEHWNFKEGAPVKAGDSLFTIDPEPFEAALAKSEADLAGAEATSSQAKRNAVRLKPLWEAKAVSQKDYDDALSAELIASASVKSAQAALTQARLNLSYTRVEAPISGVTSRALKSEGSLVEAQQTMLTTISQIDPIYVIFGFTEAEHLEFSRAISEGRLKLPKGGQFEVKLKLEDGSEYGYQGKVDFTDVRIDSSTGTIEARGIIPNPRSLLRPGQFVRVLLSGAIRPGAIAIPQRAVFEGQKGKIVMIVNAQNVVEPRPVEVGDWTGTDWIVTSGLKSGDRIIVDGVIKARPGSPVRIARTPGPDESKPGPSEESSAAAKK